MSKATEGVYFTLGQRRAIWSSHDGKINLSIFPNDKGMAKTTGFVANDDRINFPLVMTSVQRGELRLLDGPPLKTEVKMTMVDVTNKKDDEIKAIDQARILVKLPAEACMKAIDQMKNRAILSAAIQLESSGKNSVRKKRETILAALKAQLEKCSVMTSYTEDDGKIDATVDENGLAHGTVFEPKKKEE